MDSFDTVLADSLRQRFDDQLTAALLSVSTQVDSGRESQLDFAAAHFYVELKLSPDSLERVLFADGYVLRTRYLALESLTQLDNTRSSLAVGKQRLICQLARQLRDDHGLSRVDAHILVRLLITLKADSIAGNLTSTKLLGDESVKASWAWLQNQGIIPK